MALFRSCPCRAEEQVDAAYAGAKDRACTGCGDTLSAPFFAANQKRCRTCQSDYDMQRSTARTRYEPVAEKYCACCHQLLPAAGFSLQPQHPSGLLTWCRKCEAERRRAARARNVAAPLPAAAPAAFQTCRGCNASKPRSGFTKNPGKWDGLASHCRECADRRQRTWRAAQYQVQPPTSAAPAAAAAAAAGARLVQLSRPEAVPPEHTGIGLPSRCTLHLPVTGQHRGLICSTSAIVTHKPFTAD